MGEGLRKEDYVALLQWLHGIVAAWERRVELAAPEWLLPKIRNRQAHIGECADVTFFGVLGQVRQVVANLVSNAIDAVPVGGEIWLEANSLDGAAEISVRDNGAGISPEMLQQLFQPVLQHEGRSWQWPWPVYLTGDRGAARRHDSG
jgi:signal transduction histidine kinase